MMIRMGGGKAAEREPNEELLRAARQGRGSLARKALANGADPSARAPSGLCALSALLSSGFKRERLGFPGAMAMEALKALLEAGADPSARGPAGSNWEGAAPLHYAAAFEASAEAMAALIEAGARVNELDARGNSALAALALGEAQLIEKAELLIMAGARADARGQSGELPAEAARRAGQAELAGAIEALWEARELSGASSAGAASSAARI